MLYLCSYKTIKQKNMETRDYSKFKFLSTNREIKTGNVEKIKASVKEWGIIPGRPILIDGDGHIIDGQHRFLAYKELGHPIPYEVINGDVISKTMALNSNQKQWSLQDFVQSYANQNIECYREVIRLKDKYGFDFSISLDITIQGAIKPNDVRKGIVFKPAENRYELSDFICSLEGIDFAKSKKFNYALISLFKKSNKEQIKKIKDNIFKIPKCVDTTQYLIVFENILNYKKRGENRIKL